MEKLVTMTHQQRAMILQKLSPDQIRALGEFTRYAMLSRFHTRHYLAQTDWEFQGVTIDPWYQRSHDHAGENLYCDCGRRLKNQFILYSRITGRRLLLGISHFQQHASIPAKVVREIQAGINEVNLYRDQILRSYQAGRRFPKQLFQFVVNHRGFKNRQNTLFFQRCQLFNQVDLPLHPKDKEQLQALAGEIKQGKVQRLTKQEINDQLVEIASAWREISQQIVMINYLLRTKQGLPTAAITRIKKNSLNYALQRRKSRFMVDDYKQLQRLSLTKSRQQLAIKLRQLSFYYQLLTTIPEMQIRSEQARQILLAHQVPIKKSRFFGLQEARALLNSVN